MATQKLTVEIGAEDNTKGTFSSVGNQMEGLGSVAKKVGGILAAAFAVNKIIDFGKASVEAALDAERSQRQLEHAIIDVSKGTRDQVKAVSELSDALQKKSGIDGDALKAGVAQLSTFGLQSETVVKLTKSLADLTVNQNGVNATSDQYIQSANIMAKALNGQFGILEKSGIRFTAAQQKMIQYGTETQRVAALQEGFNQNLRETTDTIGNSTEGAMARLKMAFGEIQESVGNALLPILAKLAEALVPVAEAIMKWVEALPSIQQIKDGIAQLFAFIEQKTGLITFFREAWETIRMEWDEYLRPAIMKLWEALKPLQPLLEAIATVIGAVLVVAIMGIVKAIEGWILIISAVIDAFASVLNWITGTFVPFIMGIFTTIAGAMTTFVNNIKAGWNAIKESTIAVWTAIREFLSGLWNGLKADFQAVVDWFNNAIESIKRAYESVKGAISSVGQKIGSVFTGRAVGGPVSGGRPYLVGENGPELFTPNAYGRISTAGATAGMGGISITIQGNTFMGSEDIAEQIGNDILSILKQNIKL